jgi:hypothetical protein
MWVGWGLAQLAPLRNRAGTGFSGVRPVRNQPREHRGNGYNRRPPHFNPEALPFREIPLSFRFCHPHSCLKTHISAGLAAGKAAGIPRLVLRIIRQKGVSLSVPHDCGRASGGGID